MTPRPATLRLTRIGIGCARGLPPETAIAHAARIAAHHRWSSAFALVAACGCISLCRTLEVAQAERGRSLAAIPAAAPTPSDRRLH